MRSAVGVLALALGAAAAAGPEDVRREQVKLEGRWRATRVEVEGTALPAEDVRDLRLVFKGDGLVSERGGKKAEEATYKPDPSARPKAMDVAFTEGPNKGKTWPVVYELEGDALRICGGEIGGSRPAGFETKGNPGSVLLTLRRE
jgi:uncharacterized protein (TIGR03067 family)